MSAQLSTLDATQVTAPSSTEDTRNKRASSWRNPTRASWQTFPKSFRAKLMRVWRAWAWKCAPVSV